MVRFFSYLAFLVLLAPSAWADDCSQYFEQHPAFSTLNIQKLIEAYEAQEPDEFTWRGVEVEGYISFSKGKAYDATEFFPGSSATIKREQSLPGKVGYQDIEINSPIIISEASQESFLESLNNMFMSDEFITDPRHAGLHVHVSFFKPQLAELALLVTLWSKIEPEAVKWFEVSESRLKDFANPYNLKYLNKFIHKALSSSDYDKGDVQSLQGDRLSKHYSLNLLSMLDKVTVEFRLFNSTDSVRKVEAAIEFTTVLVDAIRQKDPRLMDLLGSKPFEYVTFFDVIEALEMEKIY